MAYTHTFEVNISGMRVVQGELDFDNPNNGIKIINGVDLELSAAEFTVLLESLKRVFGIENKVGEIKKFEIIEK